MKIAIKKFAALGLGLGATALATGCAVGSDEDIASQEDAFTYVADANNVCATHVQIAAEIARAAMIDLGRYRPGLDLVKQDGKVVLTSTGNSRCLARTGTCTRLKSLLSYQYLNNMQTEALSAEFPFMKGVQSGSAISDALGSSISDYLNANPNQVMAHDLSFHHISSAPPLSNCGADLKYHCFSVTNLPAGKTVNDLVTNLKNIFSSNPRLSAMTRVTNESGYLCIDPDGTGDDQTGGGSTGGSTCVDGTMLMSYDAGYVGNCCTLSTGNGYLVQNTADLAYMSCKTADLAAGKAATGSSALASNPASNATDADLNTMWKAANANAGESLKIDLVTPQTVKGIVVKYELPGAYGYKFETSSNGITWSVKKTGTSAANASHQDANFAAVANTRYIRVTFTSLPQGRSAAVASLRVN